MTEQVREQEGERVGQEGSWGCVGRRPPRALPRPAVRSSGLHGSCAGGWVPHQATLGCPLTFLTPSSMEQPSWAGLHLVDTLDKVPGSNILPNFLPWVLFFLLFAYSDMNTSVNFLQSVACLLLLLTVSF